MVMPSPVAMARSKGTRSGSWWLIAARTRSRGFISALNKMTSNPVQYPPDPARVGLRRCDGFLGLGDRPSRIRGVEVSPDLVRKALRHGGSPDPHLHSPPQPRLLQRRDRLLHARHRGR